MFVSKSIEDLLGFKKVCDFSMVLKKGILKIHV